MSRNINVNPGHYKVAGRERQGEAIHQSSQKGAYTQQRQEARREAIEFKAGPPAWETTPPNLEIPETRKRSVPKRPKQSPKGTRRTTATKQTRKTASKRKAPLVMSKAARRSSGSSAKSRPKSRGPRRARA